MNRDRVGWIVAGMALLLAMPGCTRVEDREGGMFSPFPDGVTGADGESVEGGTMELPPASEFVEDTTAPLIVDTGDPPAVVLGDDDSADPETGEATDAGDAVASEPATPAEEPPTAAPVEIPAEVVEAGTPPEPPTPAPAVEVAPVAPVAPVQPAAAADGGTCDAALPVLSPLSDIRLVASIPDAEPARAIVRFPSGAERVIQVGDLLGSSGAKVIEIKPGALTLAEVVVTVPGQPVLATHYMHVSR